MTHVGHELSKLTIRRFLLRRDKDVSGVSGLGHVAEGVVFTDGTTILRWHGGDSTAVYESPEAVERIHGHGSSTVIEWLDDGLETKRCRSTVVLHHDDDPQVEIVALPDVFMVELGTEASVEEAWTRAQEATLDPPEPPVTVPPSLACSPPTPFLVPSLLTPSIVLAIAALLAIVLGPLLA